VNLALANHAPIRIATAEWQQKTSLSTNLDPPQIGMTLEESHGLKLAALSVADETIPPTRLLPNRSTDWL
jgi:hypothetical protein